MRKRGADRSEGEERRRREGACTRNARSSTEVAIRPPLEVIRAVIRGGVGWTCVLERRSILVIVYRVVPFAKVKLGVVLVLLSII